MAFICARRWERSPISDKTIRHAAVRKWEILRKCHIYCSRMRLAVKIKFFQYNQVFREKRRYIWINDVIAKMSGSRCDMLSGAIAISLRRMRGGIYIQVQNLATADREIASEN